MRTRHTRWGVLLAALVSISAVAATVYRWVDSKGVTQFSDSPPPGVAAEAVDISTGVVQPAPEVDWRKLDEEFMERHRAREKERDASIGERRRQQELEAIQAGAGVPVPGDTFAVPDLQRKVLAQIVTADHAVAPQCREHRVVATEISAREELQSASERWIVDRCGEPVTYVVEFGSFHDAQVPPEKELAAPDTIWRHQTVDPQRLGHAPRDTDAARSDPRDIGPMKRRGAHLSLLDVNTSFTVRLEELAR